MGKKKDEDEFSPRLYSQALQDAFKIRCDKNYILWFYIEETGLWSNNGEKLIEQKLRGQYLKPDHLKNHNVSEIIADLKSIMLMNKEFPAPLWYLIPFNNGVYDLKAKKFRKFSPEDNFSSKLAVNYNPATTVCPLIDRIFREFVAPEDLSELYELAAYCLVPTYANQEIFFLLGSGRNGKSIYVHILTCLIGKYNISAVSLHDFQSNRFAGAELHGKFANISSELRYNDLNNTDQLKKLSGGDLIQAEKKFQNPFKFENHAKLIFVTNELPRTNDKTTAFYRRIRLIIFPNSFDGSKEDKLLKENITDQELEGLAVKGIDILNQMIERKFTFSKSKSTLEIEQQYENISNPIATFIEECCEHDADAFVSKEDFKTNLDRWMKTKGHRIASDREIVQYMRDRGIDDQKRTLGGVRKNSWMGIKLKE